MMKEYQHYLFLVLKNLRRPIRWVSHNPFFGYSYHEAISYMGVEKSRYIKKEHERKMARFKKVDLYTVGLYTVEHKRSGDKLYLLVNDEGFFVFDIDLIVVGTDPSKVKARIPGEGEYDILWEKIIKNEEKINEFTDLPIDVGFIDNSGIYKEGLLHSFVEVMGCLAYGAVLSDEKYLFLPLFSLDKTI
ncbi:hypothetical protein EB001_13110 [bacterium]|jgi:hypothetical protein|nr:hypothetical protein [bacterium]